ncbi:hypothetical protein CLV63_111130 [Murinocardiopsis flavida]|uniref:Uncharacterized protein n=1 Tax=Murinocardiopsis flavida TaxID=645275 RepID=A0A2P8DH45_9ACTN|nr:hypothetical protein CLV63_111130 [Murinocardiopsis flavida]
MVKVGVVLAGLGLITIVNVLTDTLSTRRHEIPDSGWLDVLLVVLGLVVGGAGVGLIHVFGRRNGEIVSDWIVHPESKWSPARDLPHGFSPEQVHRNGPRPSPNDPRPPK